MEKIRRNNVVSLIMNICIVLFTTHCMIETFRTDIVRDPKWFGLSGIHSLRFFTVLSNLFVAIVGIVIIVYAIKNLIHDTNNYPKWLTLLKHISTTAVTLTFVTVVFFLAPTYVTMGYSYFDMFTGNNFYMHLVTPLLAIISFVLFEPLHQVTTKNNFWVLLPVALYSIMYFVMVVLVGEENGGWADFYNFTFGGHNWAIPLSATGMLLVTFGLGFLLLKLHNKANKKM